MGDGERPDRNELLRLRVRVVACRMKKQAGAHGGSRPRLKGRRENLLPDTAAPSSPSYTPCREGFRRQAEPGWAGRGT